MNVIAAESSPESRQLAAQIILVAGAISLVSLATQVYALLRESDLSTPNGRFTTMAKALPHIPPLLGAGGALVIGSWSSDRTWLRRVVAGSLLLGAGLCLLAIPWIVPDAHSLVALAAPLQLPRFRTQVLRSLLSLAGASGLLSYAAWRLLQPPMSRAELP